MEGASYGLMSYYPGKTVFDPTHSDCLMATCFQRKLAVCPPTLTHKPHLAAVSGQVHLREESSVSSHMHIRDEKHFLYLM